MIISISRNSNIFSRQQADEINKAFDNINKKIENYKTEDLDYKEKIRKITKTSFIAGNVLYIRENFTPDRQYVRFTKIMDLPVSIPYDIWKNIYLADNSSLTIHILGKEVFVFGNATVGKTASICVDAVIPYSL